MDEKKEYEAVAGQWDFGVGQNSDYVAVELQIRSGDRAGTSITWYGNFGTDVFGDNPPRTRTEWTELDLKKMGWTGEDMLNLPGLGSKPVRIQIEERDGRVNVKRIYAATGLAMNPEKKMNEAQKKALVARLEREKHGKRPVSDESDPF